MDMKRLALAFASLAALYAAGADGFDRETFVNPAPRYSPAYFWMWNDKLDLGVLLPQLEDIER